jgi:ABC-2 type transport system ATP-binding protein
VTITSRDAGFSQFEVATLVGRDLREAVCQKLTSGGWILRNLELKRSSLEERFVEAVIGNGADLSKVEDI